MKSDPAAQRQVARLPRDPVSDIEHELEVDLASSCHEGAGRLTKAVTPGHALEYGFAAPGSQG